MNYTSGSWDIVMELYRRVLKSPAMKNAAMLSNMLTKEYEDSRKNLKIPRETLQEFFGLLSRSIEYLPESLDERDLTPAEREVGRQNDLFGESTQQAIESVKIAGERLKEKIRLAPLVAAEEELEESKQRLKEKRATIEREREEKERPARELEEAEAEVSEAENKVKRMKRATIERKREEKERPARELEEAEAEVSGGEQGQEGPDRCREESVNPEP